MQIGEKSFVAIDYCLTLDSGQEVDRSPDGSPLGFIMSTGQIIPGLEKALMGKGEGEEAKISVEAEDAYGPRREELMQTVSRSQFPEDMELKPGMIFQAQGPQGARNVVLRSLEGENVIVDFNHPLAGQTLHFDVRVVEVREPTEQELSQASGCGCDSSNPSDCGSGCSGCA
jgi:FKBP-type peptidyl-prolyl cis-trans isomerase SlyD